MATRLYMRATEVPPVSPSFAAGWDITSAATRRRFTKTRENAAPSTIVRSETSGSAVNVLGQQCVSDALSGNQTIAGTFYGYLRCLESHANADMRSQVTVYVVSNDGLTLRGTLLSFDNGILLKEWEISGVPRKFPQATTDSPAGLSSVAALDGDRIVVEFGYRAHNTLTASRDGSFNTTSQGVSDLPASQAALSGDFHPWFEFSQDLTFVGDTVGKSASDTWSISWSESPVVTSKTRSLSAMDTWSISWSESPSVAKPLQQVSSSDTWSISWSESPAINRKFIVSADTWSLSWTEEPSVAALRPTPGKSTAGRRGIALADRPRQVTLVDGVNTMPAPTFWIKRRDNVKPLDAYLSGTASLTGKTVVFNMRNAAGTVVINRAPATILDAAARLVRYPLTAAQTATASNNSGEFVVVDGAAEDTYPEDTYIDIRIVDDIA